MIATVTIGFIVTVAIVLLNLYVDSAIFQQHLEAVLNLSCDDLG